MVTKSGSNLPNTYNQDRLMWLGSDSPALRKRFPPKGDKTIYTPKSYTQPGNNGEMEIGVAFVGSENLCVGVLSDWERSFPNYVYTPSEDSLAIPVSIGQDAPLQVRLYNRAVVYPIPPIFKIYLQVTAMDGNLEPPVSYPASVSASMVGVLDTLHITSQSVDPADIPAPNGSLIIAITLTNNAIGMGAPVPASIGDIFSGKLRITLTPFVLGTASTLDINLSIEMGEARDTFSGTRDFDRSVPTQLKMIPDAWSVKGILGNQNTYAFPYPKNVDLTTYTTPGDVTAWPQLVSSLYQATTDTDLLGPFPSSFTIGSSTGSQFQLSYSIDTPPATYTSPYDWAVAMTAANTGPFEVLGRYQSGINIDILYPTAATWMSDADSRTSWNASLGPVFNFPLPPILFSPYGEYIKSTDGRSRVGMAITSPYYYLVTPLDGPLFDDKSYSAGEYAASYGAFAFVGPALVGYTVSGLWSYDTQYALKFYDSTDPAPFTMILVALEAVIELDSESYDAVVSSGATTPDALGDFLADNPTIAAKVSDTNWQLDLTDPVFTTILPDLNDPSVIITPKVSGSIQLNTQLTLGEAAKAGFSLYGGFGGINTLIGLGSNIALLSSPLGVVALVMAGIKVINAAETLAALSNRDSTIYRIPADTNAFITAHPEYAPRVPLITQPQSIP